MSVKMISEYLDYSDEKRSRKAVLTAGIATILIANLQITSQTLKILGLEFVIAQTRMVALGQIASATLLVLFCLRSAPNYLDLLQKLSLERLQRRKKIAIRKWEADWDMDVPAETEYGPKGERDEIETDFKYLRARLEERYSVLTFLTGAFIIIALDFGFPIVVGAIATFRPSLISEHIDQMTNAPADDTIPPLIVEKTPAEQSKPEED